MLTKIKPRSGFANLIHLLLTLLLPVLIFILVRVNFAQLGLALILLSKWRMFAVRFRHWPANVRSNAIDLIVGISLLVFMQHSGTTSWQLVWAAVYAFWLIFVKPGSSLLLVSAQALIGQLCGLMAIFLIWSSAPLYALVIAAWVVCYSAARHFFTSFDEPLARLFSYFWGYIAAGLTWLLGHWLLFYGVIAQPTLLLMVLGFGLAGLYFLEETDRLSVVVRRQVVFIMLAVITVVLVFSNWGDRSI
ncbi:MAG TPA: hypothetical protein VLG25_00495 [Patescibacteria group bacterium]|nr:hypothetical protein [Patescibacteria group bacterium]